MSLTWTYPAALLLLVAVPLYIFGLRRSFAAIPLPRAGTVGGRAGGAYVLGWLPPLLRAAALGLLVLAIAGPRSAGAVVEETTEGVPIVLAIDISSSMLAQDFLPLDRLEVAKTTIARFVEGREGDPIGLVAFAGEALTLVPPTTHRPLLLSAIESLRIGLLEDGTAIGDGLAAALNRIRAIEGPDRIVILLSDGENNRGMVDPRVAADAAAAIGVRVYTVGVGSEGVAPVPIGRAPEGFRYAELPVGLDEELLRDMAAATGGEYFRATDAGALERIYGEIDRLVPSIVETSRYVEVREWAALLLLLAAGTLLVEWALRGSRWGVIP
jgi:Ca-activated chloride channel homolog